MRFKKLAGGLLILLIIALPSIAIGQNIAGVQSSQSNPTSALQINVATINAASPVDITPVQAHDKIGSLAPVSQMCGACLFAVNADYYDLKTYQPIGGIIRDSRVLRSPNNLQWQFTIQPDGNPAAGLVQWDAKLTTSDNQSLQFEVNVDHAANRAVIYDNHFGTHTPADPAASELALAQDPAGLALGHPLALKILGPHTPGTPVPDGQAVLSGVNAAADQIRHMAEQLQTGKINDTVQVAMSTQPPAQHSLGANFVILKDNQILPIGENDSFVNGPQPRTIAGWVGKTKETRKIFFMTIGGTRNGRRFGVSLHEAAKLAQAKGMTDAINLDDGGSTTFVQDGRVINHPSDGEERSVDNAWVVTAKPGVLAQTAPAPPPPTTAPKPITTTTIKPTTTTVATTTTTLPKTTAPPTSVTSPAALVQQDIITLEPKPTALQRAWGWVADGRPLAVLVGIIVLYFMVWMVRQPTNK